MAHPYLMVGPSCIFFIISNVLPATFLEKRHNLKRAQKQKKNNNDLNTVGTCFHFIWWLLKKPFVFVLFFLTRFYFFAAVALGFLAAFFGVLARFLGVLARFFPAVLAFGFFAAFFLAGDLAFFCCSLLRPFLHSLFLCCFLLRCNSLLRGLFSSCFLLHLLFRSDGCLVDLKRS